MMKGACGGVSGRVPVRETSSERSLLVWRSHPDSQPDPSGQSVPGLPVTTSVIRIAERDEAAVLSLAYFPTPFTVTDSGIPQPIQSVRIPL